VDTLLVDSRLRTDPSLVRRRIFTESCGHASATTTLGTYAHLIADAQRGAVDKLPDRLLKIVDVRNSG
jgi:hypothetical protein